MKKSIKENCLILSLFLVISIFIVSLVDWQLGNIFATGDFHYHLDRIETLANSLKQLNFWPKVDGSFVGGYGYASSLFYPDIFLYPAALLRVIGATPTVSYLFTLTLINFMTLWLGYIAGKRLAFSTRKSLFFTILYTFNLYRLQTLFSRQDLGELMGMMFLPLVLSELLNLKKGQTKQWYILAFAMIGIASSHTISLFMAIIFASMVVLLNIKTFWNKQRLLAIAKAATLTLVVSAGIYLPILEQMQGQSYALTTDKLINITDEVLPLKAIIQNSLTNQVFHANTVNVGIIVLLGLVIYTIYNLLHRKNLDLIIMADFLFFTCTTYFPWSVLSHSIFSMIQFPWRFFSVISLIVIYLLVNDDLRMFDKNYCRYILVGLTILISVVLGQQTIAQSKDRLETYTDFNKIDSYYIGAGHEYLPSEASYPNILANKQRRLTYDQKKVAVHDVSINQRYVSFGFNTNGKPAKVRLPLIYYKGYQAEVYGDDGDVTTPRISHDGLTLVDVNGSGTVKVQYESTFIQKISLLISLTSIMLVALTYYDLRRHKQTTVSTEVPIFATPVQDDYVFVYQIVDNISSQDE